MNPVIENIKNRRSVRLYEPTPIPKEILTEIITAGDSAPSGCNAQNWRFVIAEDAEFRKKLADIAIPRYKEWMKKAPPQMKEMKDKIDAQVTDPVYYSAPVVVFIIGWGMTSDYDSSMVCQNIMLAARSFGIGSCWVYFGQLAMNDAEIRKTLGLKEEEKVYGPILLGYPKGNFPEPPDKKSPTVQWI